ncbi:MAG TPA: alcohol dehydrogenase catalytic domain-containing protein [Candidatus Polarisedimenticolia bacterium]|nr:alcohol dehydrogenase catalytic domain-containing protein [Candidatus Polarisedimenticolia bacterium]
MKAMVVRSPRSPMVPEDRPVRAPGPGEIRMKVHACGICHSDQLVTDGLWPGLQLPRVPGHEVAGVIDALGEGVTHLRVGQRVGVGWHGGHDGTCDACLNGHFIHCRQGRITGISIDGGYQEYLVAPAVAVARMAEGLDFAEAAPLLCAGVTTFNALRHSGARAGDLVGIQGLGGLGHVGLQYARAMGFEVVAISRGPEKEEFARKLGAHHYVDSGRSDFGEAMAKLGGAQVILATAPNAKAISALVAGLGIGGCLLIVGAPFEPIAIGAIDLISRTARVQGWASGTAADSTDAMAFAVKHGVRPMIERFPLSEATRAVETMLKGTIRFRGVLDVA